MLINLSCAMAVSRSFNNARMTEESINVASVISTCIYFVASLLRAWWNASPRFPCVEKSRSPDKTMRAISPVISTFAGTVFSFLPRSLNRRSVRGPEQPYYKEKSPVWYPNIFNHLTGLLHSFYSWPCGSHYEYLANPPLPAPLADQETCHTDSPRQ